MTLTLKASRTLLAIFVSAGLFFSSMLFLTPLPQWLRFVLLSLILVATVYFSLRDVLLRLPWSYVALIINNKNQLYLECKNSEQVEVFVQKNTVVTPYLTVLNCQLKEPNLLQRLFSQSILIVPDAMVAEDYRQLCVWLRWGGIFTL